MMRSTTWISLIMQLLRNSEVFATGTGACDAGWEYFNTFCYRLNADPARGDEAEAACEAMLSQLASIHSPGEQQFLETFVTSTAWIGLNDKTTEGTFKWVDGTAVGFTYWHGLIGEPDDGLGAEDCTVMNAFYLYRWFDERCDHSVAQHPFICKKAAADICDPSPCLPEAACAVNTFGFAECTCGENFYGDGETSCTECLTWIPVSPSVNITGLSSNDPQECTTISSDPDGGNDGIALIYVNSACLATNHVSLKITGSGYSTCAQLDYFLFSRYIRTGCSLDSHVVRRCSVLNRDSPGPCEIRCMCTQESLDIVTGDCDLAVALTPLTPFDTIDLCLVEVYV